MLAWSLSSLSRHSICIWFDHIAKVSVGFRSSGLLVLHPQLDWCGCGMEHCPAGQTNPHIWGTSSEQKDDLVHDLTLRPSQRCTPTLQIVSRSSEIQTSPTLCLTTMCSFPPQILLVICKPQHGLSMLYIDKCTVSTVHFNPTIFLSAYSCVILEWFAVISASESSRQQRDISHLIFMNHRRSNFKDKSNLTFTESYWQDWTLYFLTQTFQHFWPGQ